MEHAQPNNEPFWGAVDSLTFRSEAEVEQRLLLPLLSALGYGDDEITPKAPITFQTGRKGRKHEADFIVHHGSRLDGDSSLIVVEAKAPAQDLVEARRQAESYAHASRAPFLVLTDGLQFEIWQMQATRQSERVLACHVRELLRYRGEVERLLGRGAAVAHCRSLGYKALKTAANDVSDYIESEFARLSECRAITRRLRAGSVPAPAIHALTCTDRGAFVLAPSGFGKTTLATGVHHHWISTTSDTGPLSFLIPIPELAELDQSPQDYARDRLAARCPQFGSTAAFNDLLEARGARLICDGLDRVGHRAQRRFLTQAAAILRDRPKVSLVVLGRTEVPNNLGLPTLELLALDRSEQEALASLICVDRGAAALHSVPSALEPLAQHPLLLTLLLRHLNREGSTPNRLDDLFESWIRQLLEADGHGPAAVARMRDLLSQFALAVLGRTRSRGEVFAEVRIDSDDTLDALVRSGALVLNDRVELLHDALGDYLRAEFYAAKPIQEFTTLLSHEELGPGSLFPVLLMSRCRDVKRRAVLWDRLGRSGLDSYLDVLRFGGEPDEPAGTNEDFSAAYLNEFRDGIMQPADQFMAPIQGKLISALVGRPAERLGVRGCLDADRTWFTYQFYAVGPGNSVSEVGSPVPKAMVGGFNLERNVGGRNARRMGFKSLCGAMATVIMRRQLDGGPQWTNERLVGRLRFAFRKWRMDAPLTLDFDTLVRLLASNSHQVVHIDGWDSRWFTTEDMLRDVETLRAAGRQRAEIWWELGDVDPASGTACLSWVRPLLDEYWRRSQIVYRELVEHSFPALAPSLNFHNAMPVRYNARIHEVPNWGTGMEYMWSPVASWERAGADTKLGWEGLYKEGTHAAIMAELGRLGRNGCTSISYVQGSMPRFDGGHRNRKFDGETAVLRNALAMLTDDLDLLLRRLPDGLTLKNQSIVGA